MANSNLLLIKNLLNTNYDKKLKNDINIVFLSKSNILSKKFKNDTQFNNNFSIKNTFIKSEIINYYLNKNNNIFLKKYKNNKYLDFRNTCFNFNFSNM
jgi:Icc-related predicted phosphoesterase